MMSGPNTRFRGDAGFVVSIHDVCPRFENEFHRWRSLLDAWGIQKRSLAVVPFYEETSRIKESPSLVAALIDERARGSEVVLHGYSHIFKGHYGRAADRLRDRLTTRGCAEFSILDERQATDLLTRGRQELQETLGCSALGFTPPGWWCNASVMKVLADMEFLFCSATWNMRYFDRPRPVHAPVLTGLPHKDGLFPRLLRYYNFGWLPFALRKRPLIRVALHPYDLDNPLFMADLEALLKKLRQNRALQVYEDLSL